MNTPDRPFRKVPLSLTLCALVWLAACGNYADFTLPALPPGTTPAPLQLQARPSPVLGPGTWDSGDVLNPSVLKKEGVYLNVYSGFDGRTWHTGLAHSADGIRWAKDGRVLSPDPSTWEGSYIAANGSALLVGTEVFYWYQAGPRNAPRIGLARNWRKEPSPVLTGGPSGAWDEVAVADPYVLRIGDWFYLYYLGQNRARQQRIGLARSRDGIQWQKLRSNPVMDLPWPGSGSFDENGLGEPAVWQWHGTYWMLVTGRSANEHRALALAHSQDGVHWTSDRVYQGTEPWNRAVLCDPTVLVEGDRVRVWFGGGDRASPDENLHGQIGEGVLTP